MSLARVTESFDIELSGSTKRYAVTAKQGDKATRYVAVTLVDHESEYSIPSGSVVTAFIKKPDGTNVYENCTFNGATVTVELTNQTLAAAGTALCEVEVKTADASQIITSVTFEIEIEKKVKDDDAIISTDEMSALDAQMQAYAASEAARVSAEASRVAAESGRVSAESSRVSAEASRVSAEASRVTAESGRVSAEASRVSAESSRVAAETARETSAAEALADARRAVEIAQQVNEASYITDADTGTKYAYAITAKRGVPYMDLTIITE